MTYGYQLFAIRHAQISMRLHAKKWSNLVCFGRGRDCDVDDWVDAKMALEL